MRRALGTTGLQVHPLCLGGNVFGWTMDGEEAFAVLDAYVAAGGNFIDTADAYSAWVEGHEGGESERLLGRWLAERGRPEDLVLATKVGWQRGLAADVVRRSAEASLERLGVEHVEVLYAHKPDPDVPIAETLRAFDALVREGLVGHVGLSNFDAGQLDEALQAVADHGLAPVEVLQPGYSLVARERFEGELQRLAVQRGLAVVPYAALAAGLLTGKYDRDDLGQGARASSVGRFAGDDAAWAAVDAVRDVAAARGVAPAAVAVAWVAAQDGVVAPIASATRTDQLDDLLAGAQLQLDAGELERLRAAAEGRAAAA
jgi:aryl-alcohol dehydrogenase-like predicted oxidoreductase